MITAYLVLMQPKAGFKGGPIAWVVTDSFFESAAEHWEHWDLLRGIEGGRPGELTRLQGEDFEDLRERLHAQVETDHRLRQYLPCLRTYVVLPALEPEQ